MVSPDFNSKRFTSFPKNVKAREVCAQAQVGWSASVLSPAQYNVNSRQDKVDLCTRQLACAFSEQ